MQHLIGSKFRIIAATALLLVAVAVCFNLRSKISDKLRIAYTEDLAGTIINNVEKKAKLTKISDSFEYLNIGDCCGSNAQFVLANNKVDLVVMCPDALKYLNEIKDDYIELGTIIYDGDVLISDKNDNEVKIIGYMNKRDLQKEALHEVYKNADIVPMFPSAIPYALSNDKIDAAVVDVNNYLVLDYDVINLTENEATQVLVVNKRILGDRRLEEFIDIYNAEIDKINQDENYIIEMVEENLDVEDLKEKWKKLRVKFGTIQK